MRKPFIVALALLASALVAAPTHAQPALPGTLVYELDGNVVISTPNGSEQHQVTSDGGWEYPSMDEHGIIVAAQGNTLVRMTQGGEILSSFVPSVLFDFGISDAKVSWDGRYIAYSTIERCPDADGQMRACFATEIVLADGSDPDPVGGGVQVSNPTWYPGTDIVAVGEMQYLQPGSDEATEWFQTQFDDSGTSISHDGSMLAIAGCTYEDLDGDPDNISFGCYELVQFFELNGPPPAQPDVISPLDCRVEAAEGEEIDAVALSPDATAMVVVESPQDSIGDEGTELALYHSFSVDPCGAEGPIPLAQGVTSPHWSPAAYDPTAPGPDPEPTDEPTTEPTDEPTEEPTGEPQPGEGGRVDGGGAADPVAQTIELSKTLFGDGAADRVVLATAERFPDALAGSALAGETGPILVTPFSDTLDPRVRAEIARVTGGDGIVLTLGGVAAVTEPAAAQARAAAGDNACAAPFPDTCRYAGIGREHTATLIADTVVAEHGPARALLARGDEFADAITGGAYAAEAGTPILLTPSDMLNAHTDQWLRASPEITGVVVLGGVAAVDDPTMAAVPVADKRRVFGAERTATAAAIATQLWHAEDRAGGGITLVNVRHADGWQTALSGAVASAIRNAPQLGVENPPAAPTQATLDAAQLLGGPVLVLGDPALVSPDQSEAVDTAAG